ncbi:MAG: hypothetical protein GY937_05240 [bacterium]|nr:hypothetical protein [bacterium]
MARKLWIRANASAEVGIGHVMRTMAVAEAAAAAAIDITYVMDSDPTGVQVPAKHGFDVLVIEHEERRSWLERVRRSDAVLFDGYTFEPEDHEWARSTGAKIGAVDDWGRGEFDVDVLLNQNLLGDHRYHVREDTRMLLGPAFALVRAEFHALRRRRGETADSIVVSTGGSDPTGVAVEFMRIVEETGWFGKRSVLVGPMSTIAPDRPGWQHAIDPQSPALVFDAADVVLSAAGSTTWELLHMGLPTIIVQTHDNQSLVAEAAERTRAALVVRNLPGLAEEATSFLAALRDRRLRVQLSERAMATVDGRGGKRLLGALFPDRWNEPIKTG